MDNSDANSTTPDSEQPRNWRDQADGFADEEVESPATARDEPTREWSFIR